MIVADASAVIELLLRTRAAPAIEARLLTPGQTLHAPHLLDLEVAQVLRRYAAGGEVAPQRCRQALGDLAALPIHRYPHDIFLDRIWRLRANLTAHDAAYVALAEALDAPLLTRDRAIATAPGHKARVELV